MIKQAFRLVILFQAICPWNIHCVRSIRILSYSGPHFPAFELNTERYFVSLRMLRTRITPNTDTFHAVIVCTKCFKNQPSAKLNPLKKQKYDAQKIKSAQKLIYFTGLKSRYHAVINEERCSEKQNVITNYFEITGKKLAFPWEFDLQSIQCNNIPIKNILYCRSAVKYSNFALSFFGILTI